MYLSYQIERMQAAETMTAAERRAADEEVGRLAADLSALGQWMAGRASVVSRLLPEVWRLVATFRNEAAEIQRGGTTTCAQCAAFSPDAFAKSRR
jgi:hypothetical protein